MWNKSHPFCHVFVKAGASAPPKNTESPANARLLGCKGGDQVREFSESLYGKHGCNQFLGHLFRTKELNPFGIDSFVS